MLFLISEEFSDNVVSDASGNVKISSDKFSNLFPFGFSYSRSDVVNKLVANKYIYKPNIANVDQIVISINAIQAGKFLKKAGFNLKLPKS